MKKQLHIWMSAVAATILAAAAACSHKEIICGGEGMRRVEIAFDWQRAPAADPAGMTLFFFPEEPGSKIWRYEIAGREGGDVELTPSIFSIVAFNNDLPGVRIADATSYGSLAAYAQPISTASAEEIAPTGILYTALSDRFAVSLCGDSRLHLSPDTINIEYVVIARRCRGLEGVRSVRGRLLGPAEGVRIADGESVGRRCAVTFAMTAEDEGADGVSLRGRTTGFEPRRVSGQSPGGDTAPLLTLTLRATLKDGTAVEKSFDVSDQANRGAHHRVYIIKEGIEFPASGQPPGPGEDVGDIEVDVEGWSVIETIINSDS